ncbi:MAG: hypothetical protein ABR551_00190 [Gemmatimonadales bacterium]
MLRAIRRVQTLADGDLLLPCEVIPRRHFVLETPAGVRSYAGPALKQRRADRFMTQHCHFEFDWQAPIRIQHALWRIGVGLSDADTVLGPHNWAVLDGDLLLGDSGSLVTNRREALAVMEYGIQRRAESHLIARLTSSGEGATAVAYVQTIRAGIDPEKLVDLWNVG